MSFKMVAGKVEVFSLAGWDESSKRMLNVCCAYALLIPTGILTYCHVFTNINTRKGYYFMFRLIFTTLAEAARTIIHFPYIHGTELGLRTIGLDMCKKQAGGKYMLCISDRYILLRLASRSWRLSS
jgi:hypothetical protein